MHVDIVKQLPPLEQFLYWIRERHRIHLSRKAGNPKPWTDDEILQKFFFTNPYRENDKTTVWFRENVRDPLRNDTRVLMATVIFRWFNLISTGKILIGNGQPITAQGRSINPGGNLLFTWNGKRAIERLGAVRELGESVFTGAFMINSPGGKPKLEAIVERIDNVWRDKDKLIGEFLLPLSFGKKQSLSMQKAHELLTQYPGLGGFMAYEIVCDLRYTFLLEHASDKLTWCNPGPGAIRGLYRILGWDFPKGNNSTSPPVPKDWNEQTAKLLGIVQKRLSTMPPFEMREIEHSLCEYDKYLRLLSGDGRAKRTFHGV